MHKGMRSELQEAFPGGYALPYPLQKPHDAFGSNKTGGECS